ncbi:MAG: hypothetical protein LBL21_04765 [Rickettsiales bacterium]|jgi:hypothetical protein|nr:hypothetical protein [Rickettsiales bacterium]
MKRILLSFAVIAGTTPAANAAKVCARIQSYCSDTFTARTGSGNGRYCWCGVGDYWSWSGNYSESGDFQSGGIACSTYCSQLCGV